jgi:hypothetical protein
VFLLVVARNVNRCREPPRPADEGVLIDEITQQLAYPPPPDARMNWASG